MISENKNQSLKFVRFLASPGAIIASILIIDLLAFFALNFIVNIFFSTGLWTGEGRLEEYIYIGQILPKFSMYGSGVRLVYIICGVFLLFFNISFAYKMRTAFSEQDINKGQEGNTRFLSVDEIKRQCKAVPLKGGTYRGETGFIMSEIRDKTYINTDPVNRLNIGTTRSGKDQMFIIPSIDVFSRAKDVKKRPSMIVFDPKLEGYKSAKKILENRGYIVRLLNLYDPVKSMSYNPLQLVIDHYKMERIEKAEMAARTFAFSIFHNDTNEKQEPIWKNTATDLFTALIVAIASDCIEADKKINGKRANAFSIKQEAFCRLSDEEKEREEKRYYKVKSEREDEDIMTLDEIRYIPKGEEFYYVNPYEDKINCFSVINFFKDMCDRASEESESEDEFEKKAMTALDEYFNARDKYDFAASLYSTSKLAGARTKGSIYTNMQSAVSVFSLKNIARMTSESDIDIADIGYGDRPYAIFIGIPFEDESNHFIATTFISQLSQHLAYLANETTGKLSRKVRFILNECGNMPTIEGLDRHITVGLGIGMYYDLYFQSYNQLYERYDEKAKTILENCANQVYIMSVGNESADEFSKMLGNRTVVVSERTGKRFSMDKAYMERIKSQPLMFPHQLGELREGECVIYRRMQRTDNAGVSVKSYPIINEYLDRINIFRKIQIVAMMIYERGILRKKYKDKDGNEISAAKEYMVRCDEMKRYLGTALLYAYKYLADDFPPAKTINLKDICDEDLSSVNFMSRIYDPQEVLDRLSKRKKESGAKSGKKKESGRRIKDLASFAQLKRKLIAVFGDEFTDVLGITENDNIDRFSAAIMDNTEISEKDKKIILSLVSERGQEGDFKR